MNQKHSELRKILKEQISKLTILFVCFGMMGCADTVGYRAPVATFQDASSVMVNSARIYLTQLNKTERDAYIRHQAADKKPINLVEIEKMQSFSPNEIAVRLQALNSLSQYGALLGELANSDAPERISANAADLGNALQKLSSNVSEFATGSANNKFVGSVGPVVKIVGEVARIATEKKIKEALDQAILAGEAPIQELIKAISADISIAYERKRNALSARRVDFVDAYEDSLEDKNAVNDQRKNAAENLISYLDVWENFPLTDPNEGLNAMAEAYSSLVSYAKSPKEPKDLASLAYQMDLFAAQANRVGSAVLELKHNF
jgi:hypothetical protein